jgi:hypothetical protein
MMSGASVLFHVVRPDAYWRVVVNHAPWVVLAGGVLLAAFFLPLDKFSVRICVFLRLTGYPCPSCGWTRGFVGMANGQWAAVLHDCPLTILLYGFTVIIFAWNAAALLTGVKLERGAWLRLDGNRWLVLLGSFLMLALANWIYRLAIGLK